MTTHNFLHWLITAVWIIMKALPLASVGLILTLVGLVIYQDNGSFLGIALGVPLGLLGASMTLINLYEALAGIFDRRYSQGHCPICNPPIRGNNDNTFVKSLRTSRPAR